MGLRKQERMIIFIWIIGSLLILLGGASLYLAKPIPFLSSLNHLWSFISPPTSTPTLPPQGKLVPTLAEGIPTATIRPKDTTAPQQTPTKTEPFQRAGFAMSIPANPNLWASRMGASWYLDWAARKTTPGEFPEYWKMVRVSKDGFFPTPSEIIQIAVENPGQVWILGNEPDVIWQDNVIPEDYAKTYHDLYYIIKTTDPSASIAIAGISQATPLRFEYLDRVLNAYQTQYGERLPVDWWTVHGFVLREERGSWGVEIPPGLTADQGFLYEISDHSRLDYFENHLRDFRAWMAERGYRDTPLALTEFGILMPPEYGFTPEIVSQYLKDSFHLLLTMQDEDTGYPSDDNRLVQRWAWFSLTDPVYPTSNLADLESDRLTIVGEAYRDFTSSLAQP